MMLSGYHGSPTPCHCGRELPSLTLPTADSPCPSSLGPAYFCGPLPPCMAFTPLFPLPAMPRLMSVPPSRTLPSSNELLLILQRWIPQALYRCPRQRFPV